MGRERAGHAAATASDKELLAAIRELLAAAGRPGEPAAGSVTVRPRSVVRRFRVDAPSGAFELVVKEPRLRAIRQPPPSGRPRLAPMPAPEVRYEAEHRALRLVADDLARQPDPALGAVGILGYLPARHAIVMDTFYDPTLRDVLYRRTLGGRRERRHLLAAAEHAGCWLRRYHGLAVPGGSRVRQETRDEVTELAERMLRFVADGSTRDQRTTDPTLQQRGGAVIAALESALPDRLPLALGHGDYALRNVLVGAGARVTGIDAWAFWQPPVLEDLATFVGSLRTAMPRVLSRGWWIDDSTVEEIEAAFLRGYGQTAFGRDALHAYELFLLLDRWGSIPGIERMASRLARVRGAAMEAAYRRELDRLLRRLAD